MTGLTINIWALFDLAVVVYWVGVSILVVSQDREPTATLAWLLVLFAIPFLGLVVYFLFGRDWPSNIQRAPATRRLQDILGRFMPVVYAPHAARSRRFVAGLASEHARIARCPPGAKRKGLNPWEVEAFGSCAPTGGVYGTRTRGLRRDRQPSRTVNLPNRS
jgi:hypothetical protein